MDTAIMKLLLEDYLEDIRLTSAQLEEAEVFLLGQVSAVTLIEEPEIIDTLDYLREIVVENGYNTISELFGHFERKRKRYSRFLWDLMDTSSGYQEDVIDTRIFLMDTIKESEADCAASDRLIYPNLESYEFSAYVKTLSVYFKHALETFRHKLSEHREYQIFLAGSASTLPTRLTEMGTCTRRRKLKRYFEEFSSKENNKQVFAWTSGSFYQEWTIKPQNIEEQHRYDGYCRYGVAPFNSSSYEDIDRMYAHIISHARQEEPIWDQSLKEEIVEWLLYSKNQVKEFNIRPNIISGIDDLIMAKSPECLHEKGLHISNFDPHAAYKVLIAQKQWKILKSPPGYVWLASDNPGFGINLADLYHNPAQMTADASLREIRPDTIIYYPLSSEYCLRIQPPTGSDSVNTVPAGSPIEFEYSTLEELGIVNGLTFSTKNEMVIAKDKRVLEQLDLV